MFQNHRGEEGMCLGGPGVRVSEPHRRKQNINLVGVTFTKQSASIMNMYSICSLRPSVASVSLNIFVSSRPGGLCMEAFRTIHLTSSDVYIHRTVCLLPDGKWCITMRLLYSYPGSRRFIEIHCCSHPASRCINTTLQNTVILHCNFKHIESPAAILEDSTCHLLSCHQTWPDALMVHKKYFCSAIGLK